MSGDHGEAWSFKSQSDRQESATLLLPKWLDHLIFGAFPECSDGHG
jgi:hypothetical protein